ncbi:hypothetical protein GCM10010199_08400 [Dactylosporangium roseum]
MVDLDRRSARGQQAVRARMPVRTETGEGNRLTKEHLVPEQAKLRALTRCGSPEQAGELGRHAAVDPADQGEPPRTPLALDLVQSEHRSHLRTDPLPGRSCPALDLAPWGSPIVIRAGRQTGTRRMTLWSC